MKVIESLKPLKTEDFSLYCIGWQERRKTKKEGTTVKDFLSHLVTRNILDIQDDLQQPKDEVTLSTVHAAKGLEWAAVIIVGAEEKSFPILRKGSDIEEERRLMFVAVTRAKKILIVRFSGGAPEIYMHFRERKPCCLRLQPENGKLQTA